MALNGLFCIFLGEEWPKRAPSRRGFRLMVDEHRVMCHRHQIGPNRPETHAPELTQRFEKVHSLRLHHCADIVMEPLDFEVLEGVGRLLLGLELKQSDGLESVPYDVLGTGRQEKSGDIVRHRERHSRKHQSVLHCVLR